MYKSSVYSHFWLVPTLFPLLLLQTFAQEKAVQKNNQGSRDVAQVAGSVIKTITVVVPRTLFERAQKKARLIALLRQSIEDDRDQRVDLKREREIKKLEKELSR